LGGAIAISGCKKEKPPVTDVTYEGRIVDAQDSTAIPGADVVMSRSLVVLLGLLGTPVDSVKTDAAGHFYLHTTIPNNVRTLLAPPVYLLTVRKVSYYFPQENSIQQQMSKQSSQALVLRMKNR
jgi:hypothetical protein